MPGAGTLASLFFVIRKSISVFRQTRLARFGCINECRNQYVLSFGHFSNSIRSHLGGKCLQVGAFPLLLL
jgi:hypothetical protein